MSVSTSRTTHRSRSGSRLYHLFRVDSDPFNYNDHLLHRFRDIARRVPSGKHGAGRMVRVSTYLAVVGRIHLFVPAGRRGRANGGSEQDLPGFHRPTYLRTIVVGALRLDNANSAHGGFAGVRRTHTTGGEKYAKGI